MVVASSTRLQETQDVPRNLDTVVQLREWGTDRAFVLPTHPTAPVTLQLHDSADHPPRIDLTLSLEHGRWIARDPACARFDGIRKPEMVVEPGIEIGAGGLCLVADSPRTIASRAFLRRLLGWGDARRAAVELGLRSLRLWDMRRVALVLEGDDDLIAIARSLHDLVRDAEQPFVVCDRRRRPGIARAHEPRNYEDAKDAVHAARGGALCLLGRRLPSSFVDARNQLEQPTARVALVICGTPPPSVRDLASTTIRIPSLIARSDELDRIIDSYAADAATELGTGERFRDGDRDWVRARSAASLSEIAKGTRRLLALRATGSVARAAALLGMSHASLGEWLGRRRSAA